MNEQIQKKLVVTVYKNDDEVVFCQDPASFDHVRAALTLFTEIGTEIYLSIRPVLDPEHNS